MGQHYFCLHAAHVSTKHTQMRKKKDEQLQTESHTSAWMMTTQFKDKKIIKTGCSQPDPNQTEK